MTTTDTVTLYHAPHSRSSATLTLLEELGAPYRLHVLSLNAGDQRQPAYLAVNPMGKVPAVKHGDALITEQVAIFIYLADLFANAGLAPQMGDPLRGPYLRWLVFYAACFEPAIGDRALKREPAPQRMSPTATTTACWGRSSASFARDPTCWASDFPRPMCCGGAR